MQVHGKAKRMSAVEAAKLKAVTAAMAVKKLKEKK
jgi:hypothetical protein